MQINTDQSTELTYISGITDQGTVASQSFWSWNGVTPAGYSTTSHEAKWGAPTAGTGAAISVAFDAGSHWTNTEEAAFLSAMHLWSDVANVNFTLTSNQSSADLVISRGSDGSAQGGITRLIPAAEGSATLGTAVKADISIDTSVAGFGPIGSSFSTEGGYPWGTILHELGHTIGLGHAGAYDESIASNTTMLTPYDSNGWSIMSYFEGLNAPYSGGANPGFLWGNSPDGYLNGPTTWMPLDILAAQRIYGMPVNSPLSGGQTFGFHSNIQGDTAAYFDFNINKAPVITLWDSGTGNTLDVSGFSSSNFIKLTDGSFSSVGGLSDNVAIAFGTKIDTAIGGASFDNLTGNNDGDVLMGGAGGDIITGGTGNDHIYGNMISSVQGATDGDDRIDAGTGTNYVNGNAGNDIITAGDGANRLYGGAGDDQIQLYAAGTAHINGNAGNDNIAVELGNDEIHGGKGNDYIVATNGNNVIWGDDGNDFIGGGDGISVMTGGPGADQFYPGLHLIGSLGGYYDEITDFTHGVDKICLGFPSGISTVLHASGGTVYDSFPRQKRRLRR